MHADEVGTLNVPGDEVVLDKEASVEATSGEGLGDEARRVKKVKESGGGDG